MTPVKKKKTIPLIIKSQPLLMAQIDKLLNINTMDRAERERPGERSVKKKRQTDPWAPSGC